MTPPRRACPAATRRPGRFRWSLLLPAALLAIAASPPAFSQQQRIAAIVNNEVISVYDLDARLRMVMILGRIADDPDARRRLVPEVLRTLIDERLQLQEAGRRNVSAGPRDVAGAVAAIEKSNDLPAGRFEAFLQARGIDRRTAMDQIKAGIVWSKLIRRRFGSAVSIGDEEIDELLAEIESSRGRTEFRLAEIFLTVDSPAREAAVRQTAAGLVGQIRTGARFDVLARQFSQNATAAVGGDLGWLPADDLGERLADLLSVRDAGAVVGPVRTDSGYRILLLRDRRRIGVADPGRIQLGLRRILLPLPAGAGEAGAKALVDRAGTLADSISGCDGLGGLIDEAGGGRLSSLETFALSELAPGVRAAVEDLEAGRASRPLRTPDGVLILVACERREPDIRLPGREEIGNRLMERRLNLLARRYLRDLRSAAVVDIRV